MIKINDEDYELQDFDIKWGRFTRTINSVEKTGIAPRVFFYVGDENKVKEVIIELTFTKDEFQNMKINKEVDIQKEIIDIIYNDESGWISLGNTNFSCSLTKVEDRKFHVNFNCKDTFENISIEIDELIMT
ncbi:MAG: hypothetical protein J1F35_01690 [Erysipelotrichales bacterium]|nr:hypothetical protein [Erysipelotrichales bacterium]